MSATLVTSPRPWSGYIHNVLEYASWRERFFFFLSSKETFKSTKSDLFWLWLCRCLQNDYHLYVPAKLPRGETWKRFFHDLWAYRNLFMLVTPQALLVDFSAPSAASANRFKINVFSRFKPFSDTNKENMEDTRKEVSLPLHQRLQLIKLSKKVSSNSVALRYLKEEGDWFGEKWRNIKSEEERISGSATLQTDQMNHQKDRLVASVQSIDPGTGRVVMVAADVGLREFAFDGVFPPTTSQDTIYDTCARRHVADFLNGFNSSIVVYGQTGSGKTFTMFGEGINSEDTIGNRKMDSTHGIVPRACAEVFAAIQTKCSRGFLDIELSVSYVEVFGDMVSDLLRGGVRCGHSKASAQRFVLDGAAERPVHCMNDLFDALLTGDAQKRRAATAMNDRSSRAHSLFILSLKQRAPSTGVSVTSRLFFADLGGSEQVKKSKVDAGGAKAGEEFAGFVLGERMREAVYINLGLLALKKCIEALNNKLPYVPFQDSKLTMLLSAGLGGDSKTSVVICGSMEPRHSSETMATLRFGERCALIETHARNQASVLAGILEQLEADIRELERVIKEKEQWRVIDEHRVDKLAESGTLEALQGGVEIKKVTVLAGAEVERRALEKLLLEKVRLTGVGVENSEQCELVGRLKYGSVGFGGKYAEEYGLGKTFDMNEEFQKENERFVDEVAPEAIPVVLKKKGTTKWIQTGTAEGKETMEEKVKRMSGKKRAKLSYLGLSL